jgi:conserved oligomeric Golgi complex subunit 6
MRVQQTIRSQESSIISYKIANLLQFYLMTMRRTIGEDALLSATLKSMFRWPKRTCIFFCISLTHCSKITDMAYKSFNESIEAQSRAFSRIPLVCYHASFGFFFTFLMCSF